MSQKKAREARKALRGQGKLTEKKARVRTVIRQTADALMSRKPKVPRELTGFKIKVTRPLDHFAEVSKMVKNTP